MNPDDEQDQQYEGPYEEQEQTPLQVVRGNRVVAAGAVLVFVLVILCIAGAVVGAVYFFSAGTRGNTPATPSAMPLPEGQNPPGYLLVNPQDSPGMILKTFTFDQPDDWATGASDDSSMRVSKQVVGGKYAWEMEARQPVNQQSYLMDFQPGVSSTGYQISVKARLASGPQDALFGLCFHYQGTERFWQFLVDESGRAFVAARGESGWSFPGGIRLEDAPVHPGLVNTLTIQVTAKSAVFFVNGYRVGRINADAHAEDSLLTGSFGLAADVARAGDVISLEFDDFTVSTPPEIAP